MQDDVVLCGDLDHRAGVICVEYPVTAVLSDVVDAEAIVTTSIACAGRERVKRV